MGKLLWSLLGIIIESLFTLGASEKVFFPEEALPTLSGYVNESSNARMFYAFYEAREPERVLHRTPIILWLQGGPGCSSMTGNFYELGPWLISPDLELRRNEYSWNRRYGLLFIDNPVGTGFSVAEKDEDIPVSQEQVSEQLYRALLGFYKIVPKYSRRTLFVAGESYAGKFVPALSYHILTKQKARGSRSQEDGDRDPPIRIGGIVIGNGLTDPEVQVQTHGDVAHSFGLLDAKQKIFVDGQALRIVAHIHKQQWYQAFKVRTELIDWIENASGIATSLDIRRSLKYHHHPDGHDFLGKFLNQRKIKSLLNAHGEAHWEACNSRVSRVMATDKMKSAKWMVERAVEEVPVLLYQGQFDLKDGFVSNEEWMRTMQWSGIKGFFEAERAIWRVDGKFAGYWKSYSNLTQVVLRDAGHMAPADQGRNSLSMLETWISKQGSSFPNLYDTI